MNEFTDIFKEPDGLPSTRECDFEINLECDEPLKERTYRISPTKLREVQLQYVLGKGPALLLLTKVSRPTP
jgi:hypothetical protein